MGERIETALATACATATVNAANTVRKLNAKKTLRVMFSAVTAMMTVFAFAIVAYADGEGEQIANDMIETVADWVQKISIVVIAFGGVNAGMGVANQDDAGRNRGFMTIAGGAVMAAVSTIVKGLNV